MRRSRTGSSTGRWRGEGVTAEGEEWLEAGICPSYGSVVGGEAHQWCHCEERSGPDDEEPVMDTSVIDTATTDADRQARVDFAAVYRLLDGIDRGYRG